MTRGAAFGASMIVVALLTACRGNGVSERRQGTAMPNSPSPTPTAHVVVAPDCSEPTVAKRVLPEYPRYHVHLEGEYVFRVTVTADGRTESVQVLRAANPAWAPSGADAVRKWTWKPAICKGVASPGETTVSIKISAEG